MQQTFEMERQQLNLELDKARIGLETQLSKVQMSKKSLETELSQVRAQLKASQDKINLKKDKIRELESLNESEAGKISTLAEQMRQELMAKEQELEQYRADGSDQSNKRVEELEGLL